MNIPKEPQWFEIWSTLRYTKYGETPQTNKELIELAVWRITQQGFDENGDEIPPLRMEIDNKSLHTDTGLPRFRLDGTLLSDKDVHHLLIGITEALEVDLAGIHLDGFTTFNRLHGPLLEVLDKGLQGFDALEVAANSLIPEHTCDDLELNAFEKRYANRGKCYGCEDAILEILRDSVRHEGYASALLRSYLTGEPEPDKAEYKKNTKDPTSLPTHDVKGMISWFERTHESQMEEYRSNYWAIADSK